MFRGPCAVPGVGGSRVGVTEKLPVRERVAPRVFCLKSADLIEKKGDRSLGRAKECRVV